MTFHVLWENLTQPHPTIGEPGRRRQSRLLAALLLGLAVLGAAVVIASLFVPFMDYGNDTGNQLTVVFLGVMAVLYWLNRQGHYDLAANATLILLIVAVFATSLIQPEDNITMLIYLTVPLLYSSIFLPLRSIVMLFAGLIAALVGLTFVLPVELSWNIPVEFMTFNALIIILMTNSRNQVERDRQRALTESEARFRTIFVEGTIGTAIVDESQHIVRVNRRLVALLGDSESGVVGRALHEFVYLDNAAPLHLSSVKAPYLVMGHCVGADGRARMVNLHTSVIYDQGVRHWLVMMEDLTEQQRSEYLARKADTLRVELEKERELADFKARFTSALSHELRTPLATIVASTELLERYQDRMAAEGRVQHYERIRSQAGYLTEMANNMLEISRSTSAGIAYHPQPINLLAFCQNVVEDMRIADRGQHQLELTSDGDFDSIPVDPTLMKSILKNLLSNAAKYTPEGGRVRFNLSRTDQAVIIQVSDSGIGIPAADQPHLFEPFYRARNAGAIQGTGLGLIVVRDYTELHGGTLTFESVEGLGTTFTIRLPVSAAAPVFAS